MGMNERLSTSAFDLETITAVISPILAEILAIITPVITIITPVLAEILAVITPVDAIVHTVVVTSAGTK